MSDDFFEALAKRLIRYWSRVGVKKFIIATASTLTLVVLGRALYLEAPPIVYRYARSAIELGTCYFNPAKQRNSEALLSIALVKLANDDADQTAAVRRWLRSAVDAPLVAQLVQLRDDCRPLHSEPSLSFDSNKAMEEAAIARSRALRADILIFGEAIHKSDASQANQYVELTMMLNGVGAAPIRRTGIYRLEDGVNLEKKGIAELASLIAEFLLNGIYFGEGWYDTAWYDTASGYDPEGEPWHCWFLAANPSVEAIRKFLGANTCTIIPDSIDFYPDQSVDVYPDQYQKGNAPQPTKIVAQYFGGRGYDVYLSTKFCFLGDNTKEKLACSASLYGDIQNIGRLPILGEGIPPCYVDFALGVLSVRLQSQSQSYLTEATERFRKTSERAECKSEGNLRSQALVQYGLALDLLARQENSPDRFRAALDVYEQALALPNLRSSDPVIFAVLKNNVGLVLMILGEREKSSERLKEAANALQTAVDIYKEQRATKLEAATIASLKQVQDLQSKMMNPSSPTTSWGYSYWAPSYSVGTSLSYPAKPKGVQKPPLNIAPKH